MEYCKNIPETKSLRYTRYCGEMVTWQGRNDCKKIVKANQSRVSFWISLTWPSSCPVAKCTHWRECKLKLAPIFVLVDWKLSNTFETNFWVEIPKIDKLSILGFLPQGQWGVSSPIHAYLKKLIFGFQNFVVPIWYKEKKLICQL